MIGREIEYESGPISYEGNLGGNLSGIATNTPSSPSRRNFLCQSTLLITGQIVGGIAHAVTSSPELSYTQTKEEFFLTIDDGPSKHTMKIVDELDKNGHQGTFFLIGQNIARYKSDVIELIQRGHKVGNHSWSHPNYRKLDMNQICQETQKTNDILRNLLSQGHQDENQTLPFRYPYGKSAQEQYKLPFSKLLSDLHYSHPIMWDIDTNDWRGTTSISDISGKILSVTKRSIVLIHEKEKTLTALKEISGKLAEKGKISTSNII